MAHTNDDLIDFEQNGIDPELTQPREHPVPCWACRRPTWNQGGGCSLHYRGRAPVPPQR